MAIIVFAAALAASAASARDWPVRPSGPALAAVLERAAPGDRLLIAPGHYRANLVVDKPVSIIGRPGAVVDGGQRGDVLRIRAPDVVVKGLHLLGSGRNLTQMNAVIFVERSAAGTLIQDNRLDSEAFGIWIDGAKGVHVVGGRRGTASTSTPAVTTCSAATICMICATAFTICTLTTTRW
ncbi:MAG: hypothetical protein P8076_10010 [Gammaproteobacteria bacterium]